MGNFVPLQIGKFFFLTKWEILIPYKVGNFDFLQSGKFWFLTKWEILFPYKVGNFYSLQSGKFWFLTKWEILFPYKVGNYLAVISYMVFHFMSSLFFGIYHYRQGSVNLFPWFLFFYKPSLWIISQVYEHHWISFYLYIIVTDTNCRFFAIILWKIQKITK